MFPYHQEIHQFPYYDDRVMHYDYYNHCKLAGKIERARGC
jgi:hypothetical protein